MVGTALELRQRPRRRISRAWGGAKDSEQSVERQHKGRKTERAGAVCSGERWRTRKIVPHEHERGHCRRAGSTRRRRRSSASLNLSRRRFPLRAYFLIRWVQGRVDIGCRSKSDILTQAPDRVFETRACLPSRWPAIHLDSTVRRTTCARPKQDGISFSVGHEATGLAGKGRRAAATAGEQHAHSLHVDGGIDDNREKGRGA